MPREASDRPWVIKHAGLDGMRLVETRDDHFALGYIIRRSHRWLVYDIDRNLLEKSYIIKDEAAYALWAAEDILS